jgi:hypothetical protein
MLLLGMLLVVPATAQRESGSPFATTDPLAKALGQQNVYVGRSLRGRIDAEALRDIAARAPADRPLKIVVVNGLPDSGQVYGTREKYTKALHDYLGLGRGTLLVVTRRGVSVATDALKPQQITAILKQNAGAIQRDPVNGIRSVVAALDAAVAEGGAQAGQEAAPNANMRESQREPEGGGLADYWWVLPVGAGVGGAIWLGNKAAKKSRAMQQAREPVRRLHAQVVEGISYGDNYLDLLPESQDATAARQARQEAAALLDQGTELTRHAREPEDYGRAQAVLEQAREAVEKMRHHIDLATGGTGFAVGIEGTEYKATPVTVDGKVGAEAAPVVPGLRAEDIPENERGACFFCSRPSRISDLTPITIVLNGQRRKVLACADDVEIVKHGATPELRTVEEDGQRVPWYRSSRYDPYRDYDRVPPMYAPGYGGYAGGGFFDGLLLGTLLSTPAPMPYPVLVTPSGMATNNPQAADPNVNWGGAWDNSGANESGLEGVGSADFFSPDSGGSDSSDFGGIDFGGSDDSGGGFDSGGSDFGGSDFGGGDSGGGGGDY